VIRVTGTPARGFLFIVITCPCAALVKGSNVNMFGRLAALGVAVASLSLAAVVPASASTTSNPVYLYKTGVSHSDCENYLFTTRWSASSPSDVTAFLVNWRDSGSCSYWVQGKTTKAKTWITLPGGHVVIGSPGKYGATQKLGAYADKPGYEIRACLRVGSSTATYCSGSVGGQTGKGTAPANSVSVSYEKSVAYDTKDDGNLGCDAILSGSTQTKTAGSRANVWVQSSGSTCVASLEVSTNGGGWTTESRSSLPKVPTSTFDISFTPWYSDGSKHLARVCVVASAVSSKTVCSGSW
jgi:hypothetical protein